MEKRLPRTIFSADEVEHILVVPDIGTPVGLRDRAMLETFYSTGVRRTELIHLKLYDVDRERATLTIRQGKGKKDRMIPIGERALAWVEKYLREARPQLALEPDDATLFLTQYGEPFHPDAMSNLARDYIAQANLGKSGSCHTFRHTMATLMLEGGADIALHPADAGAREAGQHADLHPRLGAQAERRSTPSPIPEPSSTPVARPRPTAMRTRTSEQRKATLPESLAEEGEDENE